uniref:Putative ovule protein n=1 Tax=Solanum chacoense TaxID=4108 RepID=A0A0V0HLQ7_SOLCH
MLLRHITAYLCCVDSSKLLPHPCWILQECTTFGGSNMHPLTLKSPSNIASNSVSHIPLLSKV